jgi:tight adherence protein B
VSALLGLALGLALGAGLVLLGSPWLWPGSRARGPRVSAFARRASERLAQAGLERVGAGTVAGVSLLLAIATAAVMLALLPVPALAAAAAAAAALVTRRARTRRRAMLVVWPDAVDHLVSAVRSGLALPDAVMALAASGPVVTRAPFSEFARQYRLTGNFGESVDSLKAGLADPVADRILETLRMSREVGGGELTTVLRNLSAHLRIEIAVRSEIEARQSWVMNAARLGVAAPWVVLVLLATRPEAAASYASASGAAMIVGGLVVTVLAYRLMMTIGRLPEERRWFA